MLGVQVRVYRDHASVTNHGQGHSGYNEYTGNADGECWRVGMEDRDEPQHDHRIKSTSDAGHGRAMTDRCAAGSSLCAGHGESLQILLLDRFERVESRGTQIDPVSSIEREMPVGNAACYASLTSGRPSRLVFPTP